MARFVSAHPVHPEIQVPDSSSSTFQHRQLPHKLLKNISKIGGGEYDFIPDSAMLGDIMTHTISNVIVLFVFKIFFLSRLQTPSFISLINIKMESTSLKVSSPI